MDHWGVYHWGVYLEERLQAVVREQFVRQLRQTRSAAAEKSVSHSCNVPSDAPLVQRRMVQREAARDRTGSSNDMANHRTIVQHESH